MQMNGYADNLEMILHECTTCSEKLQANYTDGAGENHHPTEEIVEEDVAMVIN